MKMFGISRVVLHTIEIDFRICFRICSQLSLTKSFCVENRVFMQHCNSNSNEKAPSRRGN